MLPQPIAWAHGHSIRILDQTLLPREERYVDLVSVAQVADAIRELKVRGAPLIGIAAAMGVTLAARGVGATGLEAALRAADQLEATRPTAVNLAWAVARMRAEARRAVEGGFPLHQALLAEANAIWDEDRAMCERIGEAGLPLVPDGATVLTHCNAGVLATGGIGTALAPIYRAHRLGRAVQVVADETRPLLQGSRLTAWELSRAGVPTTVITDGMTASRLRRGDVTCVIVGADRIARNGDVANKIGTYAVALAARAHGVPFYVAAPRSTFDWQTVDGQSIPIEERRPDEVRQHGGVVTAAEAARVWNPAFDVTPADLIAGYITDAGLLQKGQLSRLAGV
ncbi:MAG TPA: S-methyl-5-thioribose-1-phosphate isomerase [Gemmatimonadales bacterium]|nr:S-methyl-5-thioribose-1-phosphate isomerase [Gemmatimonadales bacterium]